MIKLWKYQWNLHFWRYACNNRLSISLKWLDNQLIYTLTVNLPDEKIENDEIFLNSNIFNLPNKEIEKVLKDERIILEKRWYCVSWLCNYFKYKINLDIINSLK